MRIKREVPPSVFHSLSIGNRVPIQYVPEAPWRVEVVPGASARQAVYTGVVAALLAAG
jgi:hypothetical protein